MCLAHCRCKGSPTRGLPTAAWQGFSAGLVHVQRSLAKDGAFSESAKHASFGRRAFPLMNGTFLFYRGGCWDCFKNKGVGSFYTEH